MNKASCARASARFSPLVIVSLASASLFFGGIAYAADDVLQQSAQIKLNADDPVGIAAADVNGDGNIDLVTSNFGKADLGGDTISVAFGNGDGTFKDPKSYPANLDPDSVVIDDVNGDGLPDVIVPNFNADSVSVLLNDAAGGYEKPVTYKTGPKPIFIAIGDINADTFSDLVVVNDIASGGISVLIGDGKGAFSSTGKVDYVTGDNPASAAIGDLNGDGNPDIVTANSNSNNITVLLNKGDGTFAKNKDYPTADQASLPRGVAIADFNGDDKADVAAANATLSNVAIFPGKGDGSLGDPKLYSTGPAPNAVIAVDFNGDGNLDLITANSQGNSVSVLAGKGDGTFSSQVESSVGSNPLAITTADFDGDGKVDIASADSGGDTATVLTQETKEPPPSDNGGDDNGGDDNNGGNNNGGGDSGGGGAGSPLGLALLGLAAVGTVRRRYRGNGE